MSIIASAVIQNDISFTLLQAGNNTQNENASLNYTRSLSNGSGSLEIGYGVWYSGNIISSGSNYFNLESFPKKILDTTSNIKFSKIKSMAILNNSIIYGRDIKILATGSNPFTTPWNGGSGNQLIKPYSVWQYSDPISGMIVSPTNKNFSLKSQHPSGISFTIVVVGVTG